MLARLALRSGVDLEISWIGRLSTLFTFGGLFWTLVFDSWITVAMFIIGVTLGWIATILYTRGLAPLPGRAGEGKLCTARSRSEPSRTLKLNLTLAPEAYTRLR